ncbi:phosphatases II [Saccharata proteae CBS 121410]|uniref:Phosphatases II n=1 Tax=Saccharata proteae CBS 121410 TaxID=1314787 RepID=A0A9P4I088_9PEZI|nr:phosphatases II [Saccharata proteae CBS 121410]
MDDTGSISDTLGDDAAATDPGLLKKHSTQTSYTVPATGLTYPSIRTFYRPHPHGDKLPSNPPLPLLVFLHGLGGCAAQFQALLTSLVNLAPCLAIDLPGCGLSKFSPTQWSAYTTHALVNLLAIVVKEHLTEGQSVVFIGHSMGCSLAACLASSTSPYANLMSDNVLSLIAICPRAEPPTKEEADKFRKLLSIPGPVFDLWRRWDRRGGTESASVLRFVGVDAEEETKKLQVRFNAQSKTPVWRRMARGMLPTNKPNSKIDGLPGREVWSGLSMPVFLVAGESDNITPPTEIHAIASFIRKDPSLAPPPSTHSTTTIPDSAAPIPTPQVSHLSGSPHTTTTTTTNSDTLVDTISNSSLLPLDKPTSLAPHPSVHLQILPKPANHTLLYAPHISRTLAGLIQTHLSTHVSPRLSLGWQLQHLTTEGKWDVKNLAKWKAVPPVSAPIAGVFRAMKTLREVDETHCPKVFVEQWKDKVRAVVDISHESPVYDPRGLEEGGVQYHKFPTVSKLPPTQDEVREFLGLVDGLRREGEPLATSPVVQEAASSPPAVPAAAVPGEEKALIGVHCHYGFNRTGFFIVSYLVERLGWRLPDALAEFKTKRAPGIRHEHFVDALFVRYSGCGGA